MSWLFDICQAAQKGSQSPEAIRDYMLALRWDPCWYCGGKDAVLDHIVAKSRGGSDSWENRAGMCRRCNSKKGVRSILAVLGADLHRARWEECEAERAAWNGLGVVGAEA